MAKQTKSKEAPVNGAEMTPVKGVEVAPAAQKQETSVKSVTIETTLGNKLKVPKPETYGGKVMIGGSYDGNKRFPDIADRALTPDQVKEYMDRVKVDQKDAVKYAASVALPYFVDDKTWGITSGMVADKEVNYVIVEQIPEKNKTTGQKEEFGGQYRLTTGISKDTPGKEPYRISVILTKDEAATYRNRAETHYVDKKPVIGKPVTLLELANKAVSRKIQADKVRSNAQAYDWSKFKVPGDLPVTSNPSVKDSREPGRAYLNVEVGGVMIRSLLTEFQTVALKNNFATVEQIIGANKDAREKCNAILDTVKAGQEQEQSTGLSR